MLIAAEAVAVAAVMPVAAATAPVEVVGSATAGALDADAVGAVSLADGALQRVAIRTKPKTTPMTKPKNIAPKAPIPTSQYSNTIAKKPANAASHQQLVLHSELSFIDAMV
jgi:hypothetical protein